MAQPLEQRELELVGKVELRIALVESDAKLESILQTYLPPLLLKLASPHLNVRNKVSLGYLFYHQSVTPRHILVYMVIADGSGGFLGYFSLSTCQH